MRLACLLTATTTCVLMSAVSAADENLLVNSEFDATDQVDGWTNETAFTTLEWSDQDVDGSAGSGSARVVNRSDLAQVGAIFQCVLIIGGASYTLSGWIFIPSGQVDGRASFSAFLLAAEDCGFAQGNFGEPSTPFVESTGEWQFAETTFVVPAGAKSARVRLLDSKQMPAGEFAVHGDRIQLLPEPAPLFSTLAGCCALAVLVGMRTARAHAS